MKPVDQEVLSSINGDCFRACIESILECELKDIPDFMGGGEQFFNYRISDWSKKIGVILIDATIEDPESDEYKDMFLVATGKSPRGNCNHAVIFQNGEMVHDPHPEKLGLNGKPERFTFIAIRDYSIIKDRLNK